MPPLRVSKIVSPTERSSSDERLQPLRVHISLPFEKRQKSRLVCTLSDGREALLSLPRGHVLCGGALLEAEDGTLIEVQSSPEQLSQVTAETRRLLMAIAYH